MKTEIELLDDTTDLIEQLKPSSFKMKCHCFAECKDKCCCFPETDDDHECCHKCKCLDDCQKTVGLIVEESNEVIPLLTAHNKDGEIETVKYHLLPIYMLRCMQEQIKKNKDLEARIIQLENIISKLNI